MKLELYNDIVATFKSHKGVDIQCVNELEEKFHDVKRGTLNSILSNELQKLTKLKFANGHDQLNDLFDKYKDSVHNNEPCGIIIRLAKLMCIPFAIAAKLILTKHLIEKAGLNNINLDANVLIAAKKQFRNTTLIEDKRLAYEVYLSTIFDYDYSPTSEVIRMSLGQQYEIKLYKHMDRLGILYRNEIHLRKFGFDKTPDVKLDVPIAVDGFIINWIESKARFGDWEVHQDYLKYQYICYWNRFGPGLIIYWFGYIDGMEVDENKRFIIRDHLPTNVLKLNRK